MGLFFPMDREKIENPIRNSEILRSQNSKRKRESYTNRNIFRNSQVNKTDTANFLAVLELSKFLGNLDISEEISRQPRRLQTDI